MYARVFENDFVVVQQKWRVKRIRVREKRQQNDDENQGIAPEGARDSVLIFAAGALPALRLSRFTLPV